MVALAGEEVGGRLCCSSHGRAERVRLGLDSGRRADLCRCGGCATAAAVLLCCYAAVSRLLGLRIHPAAACALQ